GRNEVFHGNPLDQIQVRVVTHRLHTLGGVSRASATGDGRGAAGGAAGVATGARFGRLLPSGTEEDVGAWLCSHFSSKARRPLIRTRSSSSLAVRPPLPV